MSTEEWGEEDIGKETGSTSGVIGDEHMAKEESGKGDDGVGDAIGDGTE